MGNTVRGIIAFIPSNSCQKYLLGDLEEMPIDKMVDLSSMQLRRFPLRVCAFTELVKLYLSDNNLNNLPPELELLQNLQILALDFNNFKILPPVVCSLKQLSILYLGNNRLKDLPQELSFLKNLHTLWIEANYFENLPVVICELPLLKTLHAGYNPIRNIPMELKNLRELKSIWMSGTLLEKFPPVFLEMSFLEIIDVDRNAIRSFPSLKHMLGLKLVIYDHNPCRNAPKVAKGVRRVGRWSEESPEPKKRSEMEAELEKLIESKDVHSTVVNEATPQNVSHMEATTSLI
ncbi:PREDICTED: leucine-rich repeat-containing protein 10 [Nanorana parkeri]|uniref:leucine-rich repeat-containing protein 10 n=1 Tax=Nanorana parkeri TaxID=125878 RepID=UPI000854C776|nr:PREDICTED: leucine-rich repeat-containing protein 10 [Nanorana parkeri]